MTFVGAFDAKTQLSELLNRVQAGEEITITKRGTPIARLVPADTPKSQAAAVAQGFQQLRAEIMRAGNKTTRQEIRSWRNEGRR